MSRTPQAPTLRAFIKPEEIQRDYGIGKPSLYAMLRQGIVPSIKCGRRFVIPRAAFETWYRSCGGKLEGSNAA